MKRVHLEITGGVIDVGFRAWTVRLAQKLELTGWVRNASDDRVESIAEGSEENLKRFIKQCHQGPEIAYVEKVEEKWEEATGEYKEFQILY